MKLHRKLLALSLAAAMAVGMVVTASAAAPVTVTVNGADATADAYVNDDWRTMVSTDIADDLGLTASVSGDSVTFTDGTVSQTYTVGAAVEDTAVELVDGAIYVPFAPLAQTFGYTVGWNAAAGEATAQKAAAQVPASERIQSIQATTDMCVYGQKLVEVAITYEEGTDLSGVTADSYTLYDRGSANPSFTPAQIVGVSVDGSVVTLEITKDTERTGERSRNAIGAVTTAAWYIAEDGKLYYGSEDSVDPLSGDTYYANTTGKGYQSRENLDLVLCSGDETFAEGLRLTDGYGNYTAEDKWLPTVNLLSDQFHTEYVDVNDAVTANTGEAYTAPGYEAFDGKVPVVVHAPADYATRSYPMVVYVCGGGTSYWELYNEDGTILANNPGTNLNFDAALTNWLDEDVIIISPHVHSSDNTPAAHEVAAVTQYYIDKYNADEDQIIYVGNSNGAALLSETIRMYPDLVDIFFPTNGDLGVNDPPEGGSVSNRDSLYTWTEDELKAMAESGLAVWFNCGETDTRHFLVVQKAYEKIIPYYQAAGFSDEWIADNIRISAYMSWQFKYWGESDHSATRLVWSKYADQPYTDVLEGTHLNPGDTYHLTGQEDFDYEGAENFTYRIYGDTLHEWALSRTAAPAALTTDDIQSIQAYTDMTFYGQGVTKVEVTYKDGVDLSGVTADSYILEDRGSLSPDFGQVAIESASVDGQTVTLTIDDTTDATAANTLIYTGDEAEGSRQRNSFGVYCTGAWYRDTDYVIHYGSEDTEEYAANTTGMGYQARPCLELKLRHAGEAESAAACLADENGLYNAGGLWKETIDANFGQGGFQSFEELGIQVESTAKDAQNVTPDQYVRGYLYVPEDYDGSEAVPLVVTITGNGTSFWILEDGTNNFGTNVMYDAASTSWLGKGAIVLAIHDRSIMGGGDGSEYDYLVDDVNVMKYVLDNYNIDEDCIIIHGNSRSTMAASTIIQALAGQPYSAGQDAADWGERPRTKSLDKSVYDFDIDVFLCNNGLFGGQGLWTYEDRLAIAETGLRAWIFDAEQDFNNIDYLNEHIQACKELGYSDEWIAENLRLTCFPSELFYYWGESDHSTTRLNYWYFGDGEVYYGPYAHIGEDGQLVYDQQLQPGDTYTVQARGASRAGDKAGHQYTVYGENFEEWALGR